MAIVRAALAASAVAVVRAACPNGGTDMHGRCWYLGAEAASCGQTCSAQGLTYDHFVPPDAAPMVPTLLGRSPNTKQFSWGRIECFVSSQDRFHPAKATQNSDTGDNGQPQDWSVSICRLACACKAATPVPTGPYPNCVEQNIVFRHAGAHAIFADVSSYGAAGCWQNDCKNSDKFIAEDASLCARACAELSECTHWTFGEQDGAKKCFFRKSDGGRETAEAWSAGAKACSPPGIPEAQQAFLAGQVLAKCDAGVSDACPDMAAAVNTWQYAIKKLKEAASGRMDAGMMQYITQIEADTNAFAAQMSDQNFPLIMANNRQVFNAFHSWMSGQPQVNVDPGDSSAPLPTRGSFCGPVACYGSA